MTNKKPVVIAGNNMSTKTKNPSTIVQTLLNIFLPIIAYLQMEPTDFGDWNSVGQFFITIAKNPVLVLMMLNGLWATFTDPNTKTWWSDNVLNRLKHEPTEVDKSVTVIGEKEVTNESEVIINNTDNDLFQEVE